MHILQQNSGRTACRAHTSLTFAWLGPWSSSRSHDPLPNQGNNFGNLNSGNNTAQKISLVIWHTCGSLESTCSWDLLSSNLNRSVRCRSTSSGEERKCRAAQGAAPDTLKERNGNDRQGRRRRHKTMREVRATDPATHRHGAMSEAKLRGSLMSMEQLGRSDIQGRAVWCSDVWGEAMKWSNDQWPAGSRSRAHGVGWAGQGKAQY